jgi:hypothetical protein
MAPGCFTVTNQKQEINNGNEISTIVDQHNKPDYTIIDLNNNHLQTQNQTSVETLKHEQLLSSEDNCEKPNTNLYLEIQTLFYTCHVDHSYYLDLIPLPSDTPPLTKADHESDSEEEDEEEDEEEEDDDEESSSSDDSDNEEELTNKTAETRRAKTILTNPSSKAPSFMNRHKKGPTREETKSITKTLQFIHDTVDSFEVLEQTILKQKRLARLKNTDLRKKILLKRTFDLVCEIMDKENGFDEIAECENEELVVSTNADDIDEDSDSDSDSSDSESDSDGDDDEVKEIINLQQQHLQQQPVNFQLEQDQRMTCLLPGVDFSASNTTTYQNLEIVKLDQQPPINDSDLNDIIYINLINQSDLLESLGEFGTVTAAQTNSNNKKRRISTEDEDELDDEYEEYDDYYASNNQNILILNKNNEYDLNEQVLNEFSASLLANNSACENTTSTNGQSTDSLSASTCVFYSDTERVASDYQRKRHTSDSDNNLCARKRTRFSD